MIIQYKYTKNNSMEAVCNRIITNNNNCIVYLLKVGKLRFKLYFISVGYY